jgi:uncharacterized protein with beta-barrel porin domain
MIGGSGKVTNAGTIRATSTFDGVYLGAGGSVTNLAGGTISGAFRDGIAIGYPGGSVTNAGTITSAHAVGVYLTAGRVINQAAGRITRFNTGIEITGANGSVLNAGTISASAPFGVAVYVVSGGNVTNQAGGMIGGGNFGIAFRYGSASVTNAGTITGTSRSGIDFLQTSGGSVINQAGGTISGSYGVRMIGAAGSVTNAGTISGTTSAAIYLRSGGSVTNQAGGTISGIDGVRIFGGPGSYGLVTFPAMPGSVINAGTISGTGITGSGVNLIRGGSVTNQAGGLITGAFGVYLGLGGSVANQAGGTINGHYSGVLMLLGTGSVTNAGTISGATRAGVYLGSGGSVINQAGGTISGSNSGVYIVNGGTVTNAGTITGTGGTSVLFIGSGSNTLILQTGSVLNGDALGSTAMGAANALVLQGNGSANNNFLNFNTLDVQASGLWALNGVSTIGATTVDSGTLVVGDASHPGAALSSPVTVNAGGALAGQGTVIGNVAVLSGGAIAPGAASPFTTLNLTGNASFASGSFYRVNVNGSTGQSDKLALSGTATLSGGSVQAIYSGSLIKGSSFDILHAGGGLGATTFAGVSSNLTGFGFSLSYSPTDVFLNLTSAQLGSGAGLNRNQQNVAGAINNFFNTGGSLPAGFLSLFGLSGSNLGNALSQLSGEAPTGAQQSAFQLMGGFLGLMGDPLINGGGGTGTDGGALPFAPERSSLPPDLALAYAKAVKAPAGQLSALDQRWNVWGSAFGGGNQTDGDPVIGSHDVSATAAGVAAGADYRVTPNTRLGFALAGGSTNWTLSQGLGSGHGDAFMAGIYGKTYVGPVYLTGSLAAADHWMSTDRMAVGDHLTAQFDAQSYGGRIEGGYRFATALGGVSPYAAAQFQSFHMPAYAESDLTGGGFGLAYAARDATDTRSELGGRFDREIIPWHSDEVVTLTGRLAWAHDWVSDPTMAASFQALPGQSFIVNGATPAKDSALASAGAEVRFASGWSIAAKFDGEFADHSTTYAGTGIVRYRW